MISQFHTEVFGLHAMRVFIFLSTLNVVNTCMPGRSSAITDMTNLTKTGNFGSFTNCSKFISSYSLYMLYITATSTPFHSYFPLWLIPLKTTCFSLFQHIKTIHTIERHALEMTLMQDLCSCRQHKANASLWERQLQNQTCFMLTKVFLFLWPIGTKIAISDGEI